MYFKGSPNNYLLLLGLCLWPLGLVAQQDTVLVTKNFKFEDGLYFSIEDFQMDRPSVPWSELNASLASNPVTFMIQVERLVADAHGQIAPDSLWGLCLGGIPYIRLPEGTADKPLPTFAALKVRGRICYFEYQRDTIVKQPMAAYNPLTGKPFRRGVVEVEETQTFKRMMRFETGEIVPFEYETFQDWIADDALLYRTFTELDRWEAEERMFKVLLIYDDRNPLLIIKNSSQH